MSSRGATWRTPHRQTKHQKFNSHKHQRNRRMDDRMACSLGVGGMSYEELQYHVANCKGKVAHKSRGAAYQAKIRCEEESGKQMHIYECGICGKWHLTSHPWEGWSE